MAFVGYDDKQDPKKAAAQDAGQDLTGGDGAQGQVSGSGTAIANGSGGAGGDAKQQGTGGDAGSPWVNIQNYLSANSGSTAAQDQLNKQVGGALSDEKQGLQTAEDTQKAAADKASKPPDFSGITGGNGRYQMSNSYVNDAASQYGTPAYQEKVNQARSFLSAQYGGPQAGSFAYSQGQTNPNAANYNASLHGDDQDFYNTVLPSLYQNAAGGSVGSGQQALQKQIDINNPNVLSTKNALKDQYDQFYNTDLNKEVTDTNNYFGQTAKNFSGGQDAFKTGLNIMGTNREKQLKAALAEQQGLQQRASQNQAGRNDYYSHVLTPLQQMSSALDSGSKIVNDPKSFNDYLKYQIGNLTNEQKAPNNFDTKVNYGNLYGTGDSLSQYNTVLDMLGLPTTGQTQTSPAYDPQILADRANQSLTGAQGDQKAQDIMNNYYNWPRY